MILTATSVLLTLGRVSGYVDAYTDHAIVCFDTVQTGMDGRYVAIDADNNRIIGSAKLLSGMKIIIKEKGYKGTLV